MSRRQNKPVNTPRTVPPEEGIRLVQRQIDKGKELLANRPLAKVKYSAWENTTREFLIKAFGSDSENIDSVMLKNRAGSSPMNAGDQWWENHRVEQLKEQIELLESTKEQLQIELEFEVVAHSQNKIGVDGDAVHIDVDMLKNLIAAHFNNEDLKDLCFKLSVKYEDLGESNRNTSRSRSLVEHMQRQQRLVELLTAVVQERPNVDWGKV
jgi:hypothetical protein